jgi:hypothetical protein
VGSRLVTWQYLSQQFYGKLTARLLPPIEYAERDLSTTKQIFLSMRDSLPMDVGWSYKDFRAQTMILTKKDVDALDAYANASKCFAIIDFWKEFKRDSVDIKG